MCKLGRQAENRAGSPVSRSQTPGAAEVVAAGVGARAVPDYE